MEAQRNRLASNPWRVACDQDRRGPAGREPLDDRALLARLVYIIDVTPLVQAPSRRPLWAAVDDSLQPCDFGSLQECLSVHRKRQQEQTGAEPRIAAPGRWHHPAAHADPKAGNLGHQKAAGAPKVRKHRTSRQFPWDTLGTIASSFPRLPVLSCVFRTPISLRLG